jgi:hypothetical protein
MLSVSFQFSVFRKRQAKREGTKRLALWRDKLCGKEDLTFCASRKNKKSARAILKFAPA